jgi:hypothetical protein
MRRIAPGRIDLAQLSSAGEHAAERGYRSEFFAAPLILINARPLRMVKLPPSKPGC